MLRSAVTTVLLFTLALPAVADEFWVSFRYYEETDQEVVSMLSRGRSAAEYRARRLQQRNAMFERVLSREVQWAKLNPDEREALSEEFQKRLRELPRDEQEAIRKIWMGEADEVRSRLRGGMGAAALAALDSLEPFMSDSRKLEPGTDSMGIIRAGAKEYVIRYSGVKQEEDGVSFKLEIEEDMSSSGDELEEVTTLTLTSGSGEKQDIKEKKEIRKREPFKKSLSVSGMRPGTRKLVERSSAVFPGRMVFWKGTVVAVAETRDRLDEIAPPAPGGSEPARKALGLEKTIVRGTTVLYEKQFEDKLPYFQKRYGEWVDQIEANRSLIAKKDIIITRIIEITGEGDLDRKAAGEALAYYERVSQRRLGTVYLFTKERVKDFLRGGGKLPGFTYDRKTDMVNFKSGYESGELGGNDAPPEADDEKFLDWVFPLSGKETFEEDVDETLNGLGETFGNLAGLGVHEVTEMIMVFRKGWPKDPFWRWFSDGFANAITLAVLKEYGGPEEAKRYASACCETRDYSGMEKELNLRYWMAEPFLIKTPLESEDRLRKARYAYATLEAQRLIEKHGLGCVKKIIETACKDESKGSAKLYMAISRVTGENMAPRMLRYQTSEYSSDDAEKYRKQFNAAAAKKDYEAMIVSGLRLLELKPNQYSARALKLRRTIGTLLFRYGHEQHGEMAMHDCIKLFDKSGIPGAREAALESFVLYCLEINRPLKAVPMAKELLAKNSEHVPSLAVRMLSLHNGGDLAGAKEVAAKICALVPDEKQTPHILAKKVLAFGQPGAAGDDVPAPE